MLTWGPNCVYEYILFKSKEAFDRLFKMNLVCSQILNNSFYK